MIPPSPALGRREQTKVRNRAIILDAARAVFGRLGYEAATVRDIVRATELSVGTFYEYFGDKEEVFAAVADEAWGGLRERLRAVRRDRRMPFEERVHRAYLAYFQFVIEQRPLYDVLDRILWSARPDQLRGTLQLSIDELREDLLPDAASGALGSRAPELVAAAMVGSGVMVARQLLASGHLDPEEAARFCTRFALGDLHAIGVPRRLRVARKADSRRTTPTGGHSRRTIVRRRTA